MASRSKAIPCAHEWRDWDDRYSRCRKCGATITTLAVQQVAADRAAARRDDREWEKGLARSGRVLARRAHTHRWRAWDDRYMRCLTCGQAERIGAEGVGQ